MREAAIAAYQKIVLDRALLVFIALLVLGGVVLTQAKYFAVEASFDRLIIETDDDVKYALKLAARFPVGPASASFVIFTAEEGIFNENTLDTIARMNDEIRQLDGVKDVMSVRELPLFHDPELSLSTFQEKALSIADGEKNLVAAKDQFLTNPFYKNVFLSPDGKSTNILVTYNGDKVELDLRLERDLLRAKEIEGSLSVTDQLRFDEVNLLVNEYNVQNQIRLDKQVTELRGVLDKYRSDNPILLTGIAMVIADIVQSVNDDMGVFALGILSFLAITLAVIFRHVRWVVLPLACCLAACLVMVGYLGWAKFPVTIVSASFPAILIIMTMSMIIHLVVVYREAESYHPDYTQRELVALTTRTMFLPCLYTVLTTIVAFASLMFSGIRPVIDFGLMMTAGLVVAFIMAFLLFPTVLMLTKRTFAKALAENRIKPEVDLEAKPATAYFADFTERNGNLLIALTVLLAVMAVTGVNRLSVENRFVDYFKEHTAITQGLLALDQKFLGASPFTVVLKGNVDPDEAWAEHLNELENPQLVVEDEDCFLDDECDEDVFGESSLLTMSGIKRIESVHKYLESLPEVGKVLSIYSTKQVAELIKGSPLDTLELAVMGRTLPEDMSEFLYDTFINEVSQEARVLVFLRDSDPDLKRDKFLKDLQVNLVSEVGLDEDEFRVAGALVIYNNMLQSLFDSQFKTLGFVFICIMIMFFLLFRSFSVSVIAIVPNILAAGIVLGLMGWLGIALNIMTVTIAAITVGIAVDDTIHYIYRFKEEFKKDRNYMASMHRAHRTIGKAMYYTTLTIILGFSILVVSDFKPYVVFGVFTGLAMAIALIGSLTLLPKLILVFKPFGPEGSAGDEAGSSDDGKLTKTEQAAGEIA